MNRSKLASPRGMEIVATNRGFRNPSAVFVRYTATSQLPGIAGWLKGSLQSERRLNGLPGDSRLPLRINVGSHALP